MYAGLALQELEQRPTPFAEVPCSQACTEQPPRSARRVLGARALDCHGCRQARGLTRRSDSPLSAIVCEPCSSRSMLASASVGSVSHGCHALLGSWLGISVLRLPAHPVVQQFPQILPILLADRRDDQVVEHQHVQPRQLRQLRQLRQSRVARLCPPCGYCRRLAPQLPPGTVHLGGDRPANQVRSSLGTGLAVAEPGNRAPTTRSGSIRNVSAHSDDTSVSRPRVGLRSRPS
jgi:hypothetical protein